MTLITRRTFSALATAAVTAARTKGATSNIDEALRTGMAKHGIPVVVAMAADGDRIIYKGAFGKRDKASGTPVTIDSLFDIASMTKAVTSVAAMQLVEQGKLKLDEPLGGILADLKAPLVIDGFEASGAAKLRPARTPVTLKHLLTHTSGFAYSIWNADMAKYEAGGGKNAFGTLAFDPGTRWQYGFSTDWTAKVVERVSGVNLEQYFQNNIFAPLGMKDTSYILGADKYDRFVMRGQMKNGAVEEAARKMPAAPKGYGGGGGLYSSANDYVRFLQMFLKKGAVPGGKRILAAATIDQMITNQIGNISAGKLKSNSPTISADVDLHPGNEDRWGLGFLINQTAYPGGRAAGSCAWAGINNTHFWIDPKTGICGVIMMAFLPFVDPQAVAMLTEFEHAVYAG